MKTSLMAMISLFLVMLTGCPNSQMLSENMSVSDSQATATEERRDTDSSGQDSAEANPADGSGTVTLILVTEPEIRR